MTGSAPQSRVWKAVRVEAVADGHVVRLDDAMLRTPARRTLVMPCRPLAEAIAAEWAAQEGRVIPDSMPLTRLANTALDRVADAAGAVIADLAGYAETDLLCYRAPHPDVLIARQDALWDPPLAWARERHGAPLACARGVMHVDQPPDSVARLRRAVEGIHDGLGPLGLTALSDLVTLSGSLVLGLAVAEGAMDSAQAWDASRVDETFQSEQWGEDAEAAAVAARRAAAFGRAAAVCGWLRDGA
jgi:chaperone required for assembly of F1-ATPase